MLMQKIIAVVGPTASGKTTLSIELAKQLNGEIISCDSMQIYKKMNIGTAKPTVNEMQGITHHMIDIVEPYANFSCAEYAKMAKQRINDIQLNGKTPIICGGTGLYLDSVLYNNKFADQPSQPSGDDVRYKLSLESPDVLYNQLKSIDPESAEIIHSNNVKRIIRALEIYYLTGRTKTQWDMDSRSNTCSIVYDTLIIGLDYRNRDTLYNRINKRVDMMINDGLVDEVKSFDIEKFKNSTAGQAIGYKEVIRYIDNEYSFEEMIETIKLNTRHYAKRQLTWFKRNNNIVWYFGEDFDNDITKFKEIVNNLYSVLT